LVLLNAPGGNDFKPLVRDVRPASLGGSKVGNRRVAAAIVNRYVAAKIFSAVVIVLIIIDPTRPSWQVLVPLALAAASVFVPQWMGK
jgi:hypothetical protein